MARDFAKRFYGSKAWEQCREQILIRDVFLCTVCGSPNNLEVHHKVHLTPQNINDISVTLNPNNLTTLCRDCHMKEHRLDKARGHISKSKQIDGLEQLEFDENGYVVVAKVNPPVI